ncbi:thioesterase II family protein [Streptacidiphilus sp. PB12-B1b]|uniref:thioesterase II family protein n=1 Tax=Streptacidiphilus sp. PB12-B1b TaxID=2705012 RepID=UPI001CDC2EF3|nr:thioesterase domain-containing protein [Streptacidiphilus sp. PB12-B1b]
MTVNASNHGRWLRALRPVARPRARLVCFPHAGGTAGFFRDWPQWADPLTELVAVRYPGREDRIAEPCADRMAELAGPVAEALAALPGLPTGFFGHSMGASVAYETAHRLADTGGPLPRLLAVSGRAAPHRLRRKHIADRGDAALVADVRRRGGPLAQALDEPELLELVLPAIRSDYRLLDAYADEARLRPLPLDVVAYHGEVDPDVPAADVAAWVDAAGGGFDVLGYPGDHFYLIPHAAALVGDLSRRLAGHESPQYT